MFGGGDEYEVATSHQYVTAKQKKIFPEYADSVNKSGFLLVSSQFPGISSETLRQGLSVGRDHGEAIPLE
jgi:hypothetical protein